MNTYSPISGMIICQNDTGDYVAKPDYDALIQTLAQERQRREKAEAKVKELEGALALGQENCNAEYNRLKHEHNLAKLDWGGRLVEYRGRAEKAEAELKAYRDAVDAQPWATDEPIRVLLDRITERVQKAERELAALKDWKDTLVQTGDEALQDLRTLKRELAEARKDLSDLQSTFDLQWAAAQRAIREWQAEHPGAENTWPDHKNLLLWLMRKITEKSKQPDSEMEEDSPIGFWQAVLRWDASEKAARRGNASFNLSDSNNHQPIKQ